MNYEIIHPPMTIKTKSGTLTTTGNVALGLTGDSIVFVSVSGTYSGVTCVLEGTHDGIYWFPVSALHCKTSLPEVGTLTLIANASRAWFVLGSLFNQVRLRVTAISSGTLNVSLSQIPGLSPNLDGLTQRFFGPNVGKTTAQLPAGSGAANVVVVASPCILHTILVTTAGSTAGLILYDNATTNSGNILYTSPATYALGTQTQLNMVCANGITARQAATTAACSINYTPL